MAKKSPLAVKKTAKVVIVDDHPSVRDGLSMRLSDEVDMEVCGEAEDVGEAMKVIRKTKPDVAVIDIALKSGSGIELMKRIHEHDPNIRMLGMSMYDESLYGERAIRAGAMGYINKQTATRNVIDAIRRVLDGHLYLSEALSERLLQLACAGGRNVERSPMDRLTDREMQVFQLIGQGLATREVAEHLHLSHKTVENYREKIKSKLTLKDGNELLRRATIWMMESVRAHDGETPANDGSAT